jgi:hypothetical protein
MKLKSHKKYKQLLIKHYGFRPIDFYVEQDKIYCSSKDNVGLNVRDVYEDCVIESLNNGR